MAIKKQYVVTNCGAGGGLNKALGRVLLRETVKRCGGVDPFRAHTDAEGLLWTNKPEEAAKFSTMKEAQAVALWIANGTGWGATVAEAMVTAPKGNVIRVV